MIPTALRAVPRWAVWKFDGDKKIPHLAADPSRAAAVNDDEHWGPFEVAEATLARGGVDGLGFLLGDGWAGVDLDDCLDDAGRPNAFAAAAIQHFDSYTEVSPSGKGLKIFVRAQLARNHARPGLEIYGHGRYFTVTGRHVEGTPAEPQTRDVELVAFIRQEFKKPAKSPPPQAPPGNDHLAAPPSERNLIEGGRNVMLTSLTGRLRRAGLEEDEILAVLRVSNQKRCRPPLDDAEVVSVARSVARYAPARAELSIDWMNARHAVVVEGGRTVVFTERRDAELERTTYDRSSFEDIKNFYQSRKVSIELNNKTVERTLGDFWLNHPGRREYDRVVCDPAEAHRDPRTLNLWTGFTIEPKAGEWSLFKDHLATVVCNRNEEAYTYLWYWLARLFQFPGRRAEVAVAMRGRQGTGKSIVGRIVGSIFGQHYVHVTHAHHLTGHFNAHLQDAVFVFADEAVAPQDKAGAAALKTLITEPRIIIDPKGRNPFTARNVVHLMLASNSSWVIPAEIDERRFLMLNVSSEHESDTPYFDAMFNQMQHGGRAAMLDELLKVDLSTWNVHARPPNTEALDDQKKQTMSTLELWWYEKLESGQLLRGQKWLPSVSRAAVYDDYVELTSKTRKNILLPTQFWLQFRRFVPQLGEATHRGVPFVVVGSLDECRDFWNAITKSPRPWRKDTML